MKEATLKSTAFLAQSLNFLNVVTRVIYEREEFISSERYLLVRLKGEEWGPKLEKSEPRRRKGVDLSPTPLPGLNLNKA